MTRTDSIADSSGNDLFAGSQHFEHDYRQPGDRYERLVLFDCRLEWTVTVPSDKQQIGQNIQSNPVVRKLLAGNNGYDQMLSINGDHLLAGYAQVPANGWGVIVTSPMELVYNELHSQVRMMLLYLLPPSLFLLLIVIQLAHKLARPLST